MNLRKAEARARILMGDNDPIAQRIARSGHQFSPEVFVQRAKENLEWLDPINAVSEAAEACGYDLTHDECAELARRMTQANKENRDGDL